MTRYAAMFERCRAEGRIAFGGFLVLGHPTSAACLDLLDAIVDGGADMIEVGIPFSDPVADGPVIARAGKEALEAGITPDDCLEMLATFRARHPDVPVGVLTYANIVMARGREEFACALAKAGVDSLLIADVPSIEAAPFAEAARMEGIEPVLIAAPNTPGDKLDLIARLGGGYTYCVARAGVTGAGTAPTISHEPLFRALAERNAPPPVLGFGISTPAHVRAAAEAGAAGVICGSAIVERVGDGPQAVAALVRDLVAATRVLQPAMT